MQRKLLFAQLVVVALLAVLDIYFGLMHMYFWRFWWFDIPLHLLGGIAVGLFGAWVLTVRELPISFLFCVAMALGVGVAWEIFEYASHMGGSAFMGYTVDTIKDLVDDVLGGTMAAYISLRMES
jgi:hypothetical protein